MGEPENGESCLCLAAFLEAFVHEALYAFRCYPAEKFSEVELSACCRRRCPTPMRNLESTPQSDIEEDAEVFLGTPQDYDEDSWQDVESDLGGKVNSMGQMECAGDSLQKKAHRCTIPHVGDHIQRSIAAYFLHGSEIKIDDEIDEATVERVPLPETEGPVRRRHKACCQRTLDFHEKHSHSAVLQRLRIRVAPLTFLSLELTFPFDRANIAFITEVCPVPKALRQGAGTAADPIRLSGGTSQESKDADGSQPRLTYGDGDLDEVGLSQCAAETSMAVYIVTVAKVFQRLNATVGIVSLRTPEGVTNSTNVSASRETGKGLKLKEKQSEEYKRFCEFMWEDIDIAAFDIQLSPQVPAEKVLWREFDPGEPQFDLAMDLSVTRRADTSANEPIHPLDFGLYDIHSAMYSPHSPTPQSPIACPSQSQRVLEAAENHCKPLFRAHAPLDDYISMLADDLYRKLHLDIDEVPEDVAEEVPLTAKDSPLSEASVSEDSASQGDDSPNHDFCTANFLSFEALWEDDGLLISVVGLDESAFAEDNPHNMELEE